LIALKVRFISMSPGLAVIEDGPVREVVRSGGPSEALVPVRKGVAISDGRFGERMTRTYPVGARGPLDCRRLKRGRARLEDYPRRAAVGCGCSRKKRSISRGIGPSRIGVGPRGTAAGPRVPSAVDDPLLEERLPVRVDLDGTGIGMPAGDPTVL
jgi:hypothetical protein